MSNTEDLLTMVYWVLGIVIVIFILDRFWIKPVQDHRSTDRLVNRLRKENGVFYQTMPKFNGRGIVIVVDETNVLACGLSIITLRRNGCRLPVLVCYAGDHLTQQHKTLLKNIQGTELLDLSTKLDVSPESLRGTQARVYALIYSSFAEVLLIEPDMIFLSNPEYLFNAPQYRETGALFWKNRKIESYWDKKVYDWVRRLVPYRRGDNRILDKKAGNYQSRDLLLFNKRNVKTMEKLFTLTKEWEMIYNFMPGDKESYWIAAELAQEPYAFVPSYPGVIGEMHMDVLCGHTLYLDHVGNPLCWNGSLFNADHRHVTDFTHYALFDHNTQWNKVLGGNCTHKCLKGGVYMQVPGETRGLINEYARLFHDLKGQLLQTDPEFDDE